MKCLVCGSAALRLVRKYHDDRYGHPGIFDGWRCLACGHRWLHPAPTPAELRTLYTRFYPRAVSAPERVVAPPEPVGLRAWWQGRKSSVAFHVPSAVRVLDVGCGFGESLAYHAGRGCYAEGTEADENVGPVAERSGLKVRIGFFEAGAYAPASFDYVTMDQVLEHMPDPVATLAAVRQVLKPGGRLLLSTPNGEGWGARLFGRRWINWHPPYHLHVFTRRSLNRAAEAAGFHVRSARTITSSDWLLFQWYHLASFPAPGVPSSFWQQQGPRSIPLRILFRAISAWHSCGIDAALTRVLDTLGIGDNLVVELE